MAKIILRDAKGRFAKKSKAVTAWRGKKRVAKIWPKTPPAKRKKILANAKKRAERPDFNEKVSRQISRAKRGKPKKVITRIERKILHVPGKKAQTFKIKKYYIEPDRALKLTPGTIQQVIRKLKRNAYPKLIKIYKQHRGKNFLFRIDTAYSDESGFSKVDPYFAVKGGKDRLSDGRGYSIGRYLEIDKSKKFKKYIESTFESFIRAFETYVGTKGIMFGQINALTLEVS